MPGSIVSCHHVFASYCMLLLVLKTFANALDGLKRLKRLTWNEEWLKIDEIHQLIQHVVTCSNMFIAAVEVAGSRVWCSTFKDQGDGIRWRMQYVFPKSVGSLWVTGKNTCCHAVRQACGAQGVANLVWCCATLLGSQVETFAGFWRDKIYQDSWDTCEIHVRYMWDTCEIHVRYIYEIHEHTATVRLYVNMPLIDAIAHECLSLKHGQDVLQPHQLAVWRLWCDYWILAYNLHDIWRYAFCTHTHTHTCMHAYIKMGFGRYYSLYSLVCFLNIDNIIYIYVYIYDMSLYVIICANV